MNPKRKAESSDECGLQIPDEPSPKRLRSKDYISGQRSATFDRLNYWVQESRWPKRDFEPDFNMENQLKRTRSLMSIEYSENDDPNATMSDQKSREVKSSPYRNANYATLLEFKRSYMRDSQAGLPASETDDCAFLLSNHQPIPSGTLFDDSCFLKTCENLQDENESRVIVDILRLITPSAENLAAQGNTKLEHLKEHINAGWNSSIPVQGPRPQPDYSVGFRASSFTNEQMEKLNYSLKWGTKSYFSSTMKMYFPFLTSEVKCGQQAIDIANRQNAHSMTVAMTGLVELFRRVGREKELHRSVLGFSITHNNDQVKIYAHYPEIHETATECYRHPLRNLVINDSETGERWAAYRFVRNVYDTFAPKHRTRILEAIDQLPAPRVEPSRSIAASVERSSTSQEKVAKSAPSSSNESVFKKPEIPVRRVTTAQLQAQVMQLTEENKKEKDQLLEALNREREDYKQIMIREREERDREREESNRRQDELMGMLRQLMPQSKDPKV